MAVPKKRTSKAKRNVRKTKWKEKALRSSRKALSTALSLLKRRDLSEKSSSALAKEE
uniref:Large ribosomal subunit protein bL32c n=1 Tax=Botryococcus braunii TaxID=38881 RepID=A0A097KQB4_BOTBR|nr:ribosomal protein L32 [Botryococcus braunii]AIT95357.1 ribosomal protein L32 [Botryococcus braunii]